MDSEELAAPLDLEKVNKNGVGADLAIVNETLFKGAAWIWKCSQPLLTQNKSMKQLPKVTRGFLSAHNPY